MNISSSRRTFIIATAASVGLAGCGQSGQSKVVLLGVEIIAARIGERLVQLPHLAIRILGVVLIITADAARLAIDYFDEQRQDRRLEETLSEKEQRLLEDGRAVVFVRRDGKEESVTLKPNVYMDQAEAK